MRGLASHYATGSEERKSPPKRFEQQARPPSAGSKSGRRPKLTTAVGCSFAQVCVCQLVKSMDDPAKWECASGLVRQRRSGPVTASTAIGDESGTRGGDLASTVRRGETEGGH